MQNKGLKVAQVHDYFAYDKPKVPGNNLGSRYVGIETALQEKLDELGDVKIEKVIYQYAMAGENDNHNVLILYRPRKKPWYKRLREWLFEKLPQEEEGPNL